MTTNIAYPPELVVKVSDFKAVALYEPSTGKIVHMHIVNVLKGGRAVGEQEAVETAQREAKRVGHDVAKLRTKLSTNTKHITLPHRINVQTGEFVALPFEMAGLLTPRP
jgi:hypothetical protein